MNSFKATNTESAFSGERRELIGMAPLEFQLKHPDSDVGSIYLAEKLEGLIQTKQHQELGRINTTLPPSTVAPIRQNETSADFLPFSSQLDQLPQSGFW